MLRKAASRLLSAGKLSVIAGAGLVFVSQTSPETAQSNIAAWLHVIGIDRVPQMFARTSADTWGTVIGIIEIALSILWILYLRGTVAEARERDSLRSQGIYLEEKKLFGGPLGWFFDKIGRNPTI